MEAAGREMQLNKSWVSRLHSRRLTKRTTSLVSQLRAAVLHYGQMTIDDAPIANWGRRL